MTLLGDSTHLPVGIGLSLGPGLLERLNDILAPEEEAVRDEAADLYHP